ncbi:MAG: hypothetical protein M1823_005823 [Watsoniomyces obsoletus]|nr:MAG: hypothetical protein M1823_005823 [Watsoniomyces obsoletus]
MVGVAGRSKGCHTCRQRKIRCDLQQPECARCMKSNRTCGGYQRAIVFKDESTKLARRAHVTSTAVVDPQHAVRAQLFSVFLNDHLPVAEKHHASQREPMSWVQIILDFADPGKALSSALSALSMARLGRVNQDRTVSMQGQRLYAQALSELQKALWDQSQMFRDETLAACKALETYELLECSDDRIDAWMVHGTGMARLVQLRGVNRHTSDLGRQLFIRFRDVEIIQCLSMRRSTFLADPEWSSIPWGNGPKTTDDQLLDLMAKMPAIFEEADSIPAMHPRDAVLARLSLMNRCWDLQAEFERWYEQAQPSTPEYWSVFATISNPTDDPVLGKVFPTALYFPSLRLAIRYLYYWTSIILVQSTIRITWFALEGAEIDYSKPPHPAEKRCRDCSTAGLTFCSCGRESNSIRFDMSKVRTPPDHEALAEPARNIARSVEYCSQPEQGNLGAIAVVFPLRAATECFQHRPYPEEHEKGNRPHQWCQAALEAISVTRHLPFSSRIRRTAWGYRPSIGSGKQKNPCSCPGSLAYESGDGD